MRHDRAVSNVPFAHALITRSRNVALGTFFHVFAAAEDASDACMKPWTTYQQFLCITMCIGEWIAASYPACCRFAQNSGNQNRMAPRVKGAPWMDIQPFPTGSSAGRVDWSKFKTKVHRR
jgi:hypothetical protein